MVIVGEDSTAVSAALLCLSLWLLCPLYVPATDTYLQLSEGRYSGGGSVVWGTGSIHPFGWKVVMHFWR
jgi:hypothetical protein